MHVASEPAIPYFGTPVVVISTVNDDASANLAPMSSAFWLGWRCVLGLGSGSQTARNLRRSRECVLNLPSQAQVSSVDRLAMTTDAVDAAGEYRLDGISILLVDDEDDARYVAEVALTTLGAQVAPASSAAAVLRMLSERRYDGLVSDIGMPDMDGIALISEIRSRFRATSADLPAVALTAFAMEADRQIALGAGFDEYVAKPISLSALGSAVVRASRALVG